MGHSIGQYSALLTPERVAAGVSDPGWDVHIGGGGYGFTQYHDAEGGKSVYERYPGDGVELIVHDRDWHGARPSELEIVEEFRLLFNLWEDRAARTYYDFDGSGDPMKAAVITDDGVRVLPSLLRRYQAAKQMYLALYLDSTRWSDDLPADEFVGTTATKQPSSPTTAEAPPSATVRSPDCLASASCRLLRSRRPASHLSSPRRSTRSLPSL